MTSLADPEMVSMVPRGLVCVAMLVSKNGLHVDSMLLCMDIYME